MNHKCCAVDIWQQRDFSLSEGCFCGGYERVLNYVIPWLTTFSDWVPDFNTIEMPWKDLKQASQATPLNSSLFTSQPNIKHWTWIVSMTGCHKGKQAEAQGSWVMQEVSDHKPRGKSTAGWLERHFSTITLHVLCMCWQILTVSVLSAWKYCVWWNFMNNLLKEILTYLNY